MIKIPKVKKREEIKGIRFGLCCLNTELREKHKIFASHTVRLATVEKEGIDCLIKCGRINCKHLLELIEWNEKNGIKVLRLSSELFPHYTNPKSPVKYSLELFDSELKQVGDLAKEYGHRLTFRPGQYNVLATPNEKFLSKTIDELKMHAEIFDRMGVGRDSVMVIHAGGFYKDKNATKKRWAKRYLELPDNIRSRLVLENCEKAFSIEDCLEVNLLCGVPIVFDNLHFDCYVKMHPSEDFLSPEKYIPYVLKTWGSIRPKFHISEQAVGERIGKHADYINTIPSYYLDIYEKYGVEIDVMVEAKMKEKAIMRLMN